MFPRIPNLDNENGIDDLFLPFTVIPKPLVICSLQLVFSLYDFFLNHVLHLLEH